MVGVIAVDENISPFHESRPASSTLTLAKYEIIDTTFQFQTKQHKHYSVPGVYMNHITSDSFRWSKSKRTRLSVLETSLDIG